MGMHVRRGVFGGDAAIVKSMWNVVSFWCFRGGILVPRPFILPWLRQIYMYIYICAVLYNIQSPHHLAAGFCFCFLFFLSLLWSCCGVFCRRNNLWQSEAKGGLPPRHATTTALPFGFFWFCVLMMILTTNDSDFVVELLLLMLLFSWLSFIVIVRVIVAIIGMVLRAPCLIWQMFFLVILLFLSTMSSTTLKTQSATTYKYNKQHLDNPE